MDTDDGIKKEFIFILKCFFLFTEIFQSLLLDILYFNIEKNYSLKCFYFDRLYNSVVFQHHGAL